MSSALRNAVKRKTHKERSQLSDRKRYGLLEKKKDYVLRAKDFHKKEDAINALKRKAAYRNPDEFYFAMQNSKTEDGVHKTRSTTQNKYTEDELKVMKTQDVKYVQLKAAIEAKRVEKMKRNLHGIGVSAKRKHTVFVDTEEEAKSFDAAKHFDTAPELVGRTFNRPRLAQLEDEDAVVGVSGDADASTSGLQPEISIKKLTRMQKGAYKTYNAYEERAKRLKDMTGEMAMQKIISHAKGPKRKITKTNADGETVTYFKWKPQRQK
jgi:U3 small nucleolar RNA-associated protein 11|uniref:U3 small nucleolar RNA-associated protein 11 n=1 Tax=Ostreococcus mediterraneus TaxID=1486918 RepID=A0A6T5Y7T2_9CHLO|mmetsp:Transcript_5975/g.21566  ORF Transcript_5975/g.21566 Transcript_5975/m.21566 type:complete len:266 (-) Transcript_5975:91-888(-)